MEALPPMKAIDVSIVEEVIQSLKESIVLTNDENQGEATSMSNTNGSTGLQLDKLKEVWLKKLDAAPLSKIHSSSKEGISKKSTKHKADESKTHQCDDLIAQLDGMDDEPVLIKQSQSSMPDDESDVEKDQNDNTEDELDEDDSHEDDNHLPESDEGDSTTAQEEILNSDDDLPNADEQMSELLTYNDNLIVCKCGKIVRKAERGGLKYKFVLKDGLMRIKGQEFAFSKALGDAMF